MRFERNEPVVHENDALIITASPSAVEPAPRPGATTSSRPTRPPSVLRRVARAGFSLASSLQPMIWSGTVPAIIAATLESILVSATWTSPTPSPRSSPPAIALAPSSARVIRSEVPRHARIAPSSTAAVRKRVPAARSGGIVSTAILIPKYVEPQTTYTMRSAIQTCLTGAVMQRRNAVGAMAVRTPGCARCTPRRRFRLLLEWSAVANHAARSVGSDPGPDATGSDPYGSDPVGQSQRRDSRNAALISPTWLYVCGKLPLCSSVSGRMSSE